ncbi:Gti1/Pac2 family-domain-containing protein, partial [Apodospora peruviana]
MSQPSSSATNGEPEKCPLPSYTGGIILNSFDALIILMGTKTGQLIATTRRPGDPEKENLIVSGNIFCYEHSSSGIKRWTDSKNWSPSRVHENFLLYRELNKPYPAGEKKRARKKDARNAPRQGGLPRETAAAVAAVTAATGQSNDGTNNHDPLRPYIGSLVDSYDFKQKGGLVKRTIPLVYDGVPHHVVSYYSIEDALKPGTLTQPSQDVTLARLCFPDNKLINEQKFKFPIYQEY